MLGLGSSKNARLLQAKISEYNQIALDAMRAKNLFSFVKRAREVFGGVDPIVYQPCAYGVLIHSMWGEESEDKVFEEYKRINNLML